MVEIFIVVMVVLLAGLVAGGVVAISRSVTRRRQVREAVSAYGWTLDEGQANPERVAPLALSPFDLGYDRTVTNVIVGRASDGRSFQCFEYSTTQPDARSRVTMVELPAHYPALFVCTDAKGHSRFAVQAAGVPLGARWAPILDAASHDPDFAAAALSPTVLDEVARWAEDANGPDDPAAAGLDLAIDGNNLVALRTPSPREPEKLRVFVDHLSRVAGLLDHAALSAYVRQPKQPRLGFRGTDWIWEGETQAPLQEFASIGPVGRGDQPRIANTVRGTHRGIGFVSFQYNWTTWTTTGGGATGHQQRRVRHDASVLALTMPSLMPTLSITAGKQSYGINASPVLPTGDAAFDKVFDLRCSHPAFATDIASEPMRRWLMHWRPPCITITGATLLVYPREHTPWALTQALEIACAFLATIDDRVWTTMGIAMPALTSERGTEPEGMVTHPVPPPGAALTGSEPWGRGGAGFVVSGPWG